MLASGRPRDGDAGEDKDGADDAGGGQGLAEENVGDEEGDDRNQVESERAADRPEPFAGLVPGDEARGTREKSEEGEVGEVREVGEARGVPGAGEVNRARNAGRRLRCGEGEDQEREHENERPEEGPADRGDGMPAASVHDRDGRRIDAPAQGRPERERIADWTEMEGSCAAERDKRHAAERKRATDQEAGGERPLAERSLPRTSPSSGPFSASQSATSRGSIATKYGAH